MKNINGFTITEVLVSLTILLILATVFLPISSFVSTERKVLSHKRTITYQLHDELQNVLYHGNSEHTFHKEIESIHVEFYFQETENRIVKGCANWINIRNRQEEVCFHGMQIS